MEAHTSSAQQTQLDALSPRWEQDEPLRLILDSAHEAFVSIDAEGRVLLWNRAAADTFGWSEQDAVGRSLSELIIPERYRDAHAEGLRRFLATGQGNLVNRRFEIEALHRDGHEVPVELTIAPMVIEGRTVFNAFMHDISERRDLDAAAHRLAAIVESSQDAIIGGTLEGTVVSWNQSAERMLGYSADEIVGRPVSSLWPENSLGHFQEVQARLLRGEGIATADSQRVRKDGSIIDVSVTMSPVKDSSGRVIAVASILRDITERREAEATTRLLASVVESSNDAIMAGGLDGTVTSWNAGAERLYGYSAEEMIGQSIARVRPQGNLDDVADIQAALATGRPVPSFETQEVRKDGARIDVSVSISPVKDHAGRVSGVASIVRDITERRAAEDDARLLASVVESSDDAIVARDLDGTVRSWNPAAERVLGYAAGEMIGRSTAPLWREDRERFEQMQKRLAAGERVPTFEARVVRGDGEVIDVSVTASPMKDPGGGVTGVAVIFRDITASKRAARELAESRERSERAFLGAPVGMALVSPEGTWLTVNPALCRLLGRDEAELIDTQLAAITHPDDVDSDRDQLHQTLAGQIEGYELEKRYLRPDGSVVWGGLSVSLVRDHERVPLYLVAQVQDVTERKEREEELLRYTEHLNELALQDPLTGLRNYRDFHAMIETELARSRRYESAWSVVLLDVDHFQEINASRGHFEGDRVLREVGAALEATRRSSDLAARIGSDEFALVLAGTSGEEARRTAERIVAELAARVEGLSVSYGTASWPDDGDSKELVLVRADMQLQATKPHNETAPGGPTQASRHDGASAAIHRILELAREQLGMDVAYVAELTDTSQVLRVVVGDASSFGVAGGATMPLEATYCSRMVAGRVPNAVPDTGAEPELASLPITAAAQIGSYLGVPLELGDGRVYGTLCAVSHDPTPELAERHVELMRFLAGLIVERIEREEREAIERRTHAELAGIHALLSALVARDHYTGEHSKTVVQLAIRVARRLGLPADRVVEVEQVALLHDIGKVGIPDSVLQKRGPLTDREWEIMRQHPAIGARILAGTETLSHLAAAVKAEHEHFDGVGYPDGLSGEDIPLASRIGFACDAYHAMTSDRPYRAALAPEQARAELQAGAGGQFDPEVVAALLAVLEEQESGGTTLDAPHSQELAARGARVLESSLPPQTPVWEPHGGTGSATALGEVRAVCRRCGTHVSAVVARAALSGSCGNCGGYELDLLGA